MKRPTSRSIGVTILTIALAALVARADASVHGARFDQLVASSEMIVVGKVVGMHWVRFLDGPGIAPNPPSSEAPLYSPGTLGYLRVAEVEVSEVRRGDPKTKTVFVLAQNRWGCDESQYLSAKDRGFFFLDGKDVPEYFASLFGPAHGEVGQRVHDQWRRSFLDQLEQLTHGRPFTFLAWYGAGRLIVETKDGKDWVQQAPYMRMPANIRRGKDGELRPEYVSGEREQATREEFEAALAEELKKPAPAASAQPQASASPTPRPGVATQR